MIMDKEVAKEIIDLVKQGSYLLDNSVAVARQKSSEAEAEEYAVAVASALAEILVEVLNPLYRNHPELAPEGYAVPRRPRPPGPN